MRDILNFFTFRDAFATVCGAVPNMKTQPATAMAMMLAALALASCAPPVPKIQRIEVSSTVRPDSSLTGQVHHQVNAYRATKGTGPLQRHSGLDRLAHEHCEYLRKHRGTFQLSGKNVSHFGFESRALAARELYNMHNVSENVAAATHPGNNKAGVLVSLWKGSKDHHKNMLDDWTHTGIGVVVDSDGTVFSTQLFSTVSMNQISVRERFNRF
jgi:uncharacterized protein YkwD